MNTPEILPSANERINDIINNNTRRLTYIEDPNLALEVAYGERPYALVAIEARNNGLNDEHGRLMDFAAEAGHVAGSAYITGLNEQLNRTDTSADVNNTNTDVSARDSSDQTEQDKKPSLWESLTSEQLLTAEKTRICNVHRVRSPRVRF